MLTSERVSASVHYLYLAYPMHVSGVDGQVSVQAGGASGGKAVAAPRRTRRSQETHHRAQPSRSAKMAAPQGACVTKG